MHVELSDIKFFTGDRTLLVNKCFPRASGDVPGSMPTALAANAFSPRERGCSFRIGPIWLVKGVFPARAGMFRSADTSPPKNTSFPRASGDVPEYVLHIARLVEFSPRERGCSGGVLAQLQVGLVFPARAGMFRLRWRRNGSFVSFPRASGDVPVS